MKLFIMELGIKSNIRQAAVYTKLFIMEFGI